MVSEFKAFLMRGNVVDLAVGVVIGAAFAKIVDAIVTGLFMPIIGLAMQGVDFSNYKIKLTGETVLPIGMVIQAIFNFVIVGACLFLVVKAINKMQKKEEKPTAPPEPTASEKLLAEIRDELKKR